MYASILIKGKYSKRTSIEYFYKTSSKGLYQKYTKNSCIAIMKRYITGKNVQDFNNHFSNII